MLTTSLSALLSLSEWLFWEVNCFRVGQFGTVPLASYSIAYSVEPVFFMVPLGLSTALANSVGNLLGARRVGDARRLVLTASAVGFATICAYTFGVWVAGRSLARLFTRDAKVLAATAHMWPWFCAFMLISGPFALIIGLNRGLGLQRHNAACVLLLVWPVGAPLILIYAQSPSNVWQLLSRRWAKYDETYQKCINRSLAEALAQVYIINSPSWAVAFYKRIKWWVPANTQRKIRLLGTDCEAELLQVMSPEVLHAMLHAFTPDGKLAAPPRAHVAAEAVS